MNRKRAYLIAVLVLPLALLGCTSQSFYFAPQVKNTLKQVQGSIVLKDNRQVIIIPSDNLFRRGGGTRLIPNAYKPLTNLAKILLADYTHATITIVGHTDTSGSPKRNQALSITRARVVAGYLRYQGFPRDQLRINGVGDTQPITGNNTPEQRAKNRRIEIWINK